MRSVIFLGLVLLIGVSASAQSFKGGFKLGVNASQVSGDMLAGFDKAGINGGLVLTLPLGEYSSFQTELIFSQKGSRRNPSKTSTSKYIMRLNYIEMPFLFQRRLNKTLTLEAGASFAYLIKNSDVEYDANGLIPGMPPFNSYELAVHFGINYQLSDQNYVGFRYSNSVLPIREHAGGGTYWLNQGQYNSLISLALFHTFGKS